MYKKFNLFLVFIFFTVFGFSQPTGWMWATSTNSKHNITGVSCISGVTNDQVTAGIYKDTVNFNVGMSIVQLVSMDSTEDIYLTKADDSGNLLWVKSIGGIGADNVMAIAALESTGEIFITGYFTGTCDFDPDVTDFNLTSIGNEDIFIAKYTTDGYLVWAKRLGGTSNDRGLTITVNQLSGDVYYAGSFRGNVDFDPDTALTILSFAGNNNDMFISRLDSAGNFNWVAGAGNNLGGDVTVLEINLDLSGNGSIISTGSFEGNTDFDGGTGTFMLNSTTQDVYIMKQELNGQFKWAGQISGPNADQGNSFTVGQNGEIFLTGYYSQTADMDPGSGTANLTSTGATDIFLVALDSSGNYIRSASIGGSTGSDFSSAIIYSTTANELYVSGGFHGNSDFDPQSGIFTLTSAGATDLFIMSVDTTFNLKWAERAGGTNTEYSVTMVVDHLNMIRMTGIYYSPVFTLGNTTLTNTTPANYDVFSGKFHPGVLTGLNNFNGSEVSFYIWPNPANEFLYIKSDAIDDMIISIFDLTGKKVLEQTVPSDQTNISLTSLQDGMYILNLNNNSSRFIIKH